ncbi:sigma-70 family RNA polymerase sigma factor [Achromobacter pestifer]|uniref:Sigma-70 family RNA polymerase sigma factor n=1 Tax=Achromobacter pestifer TaxID=1353889 RepID=A0A7D4E2U8_9BURK|nr:sigma-70 family RNA polymerase sigma factor [Achromobacter pestifer]QKH36810.1 sigma-70 family RNA polymerase sigma factor [Achromobacter pestifer]
MIESPSPHPADSMAALYSGHHGWLLAWLRKRLGSPADAADLAHDTFLRVLTQTRPEIREPRAFLSTIAHGILANFYRRRDVEQAFLRALAALPEAQAPSPETRAIVLETLIEIDRRMSSLPDAVCQAFYMAQIDGLKQSEIAARLRVSLPTVQRYVARALQQCFF